MKPEFFHGSVEKGSNKLYTESNRQIVTPHGSFIKIGSNDIFYRVESIEDLHIKRKFIAQGKHITIKGNYQYKLAAYDVVKIYFDEYEALEIKEILTPTDDQFGGYSLSQKIYAQGGIASTSASNITGESVELEVTKIDENGKILDLKNYDEKVPEDLEMLAWVLFLAKRLGSGWKSKKHYLTKQDTCKYCGKQIQYRFTRIGEEPELFNIGRFNVEKGSNLRTSWMRIGKQV